MRDLFLTNTLSRKKELFTPIHPGSVGMYVCGPTVYGDAHLGHARPGITYDVLFRLLKHLGYKVRYVRNITDVGHLEHDADEGEDKIAKKARLEQVEPMEVVQTYTFRYHEAMRLLNVAPPSIEPRASGHIIEQIETIKKILEAGYAYISNGSVYFDVGKYNEKHNYGILSGRTLDETLEGTRSLDGQSDKKAPYDFALWKKAEPEHIMHWPSPWSEGFPGWHLECSVMGEKYLGEEFDIHGGGMDLMFPHHECEIAQNVASRGTEGVHYWVHNNMITINGQKMGKSLGNFITLPELFSGKHPKLTQAYSPMTIRFFILQAHYRSTLDFSNEALQAAEKGLKRVMQAAKDLREMASAVGVVSSVVGSEGNPADALKYGEFITSAAPDTCPADSEEVKGIFSDTYAALCDDLNTPIALSHIFDAVRLINSAKAKGGAAGICSAGPVGSGSGSGGTCSAGSVGSGSADSCSAGSVGSGSAGSGSADSCSAGSVGSGSAGSGSASYRTTGSGSAGTAAGTSSSGPTGTCSTGSGSTGSGSTGSGSTGSGSTGSGSTGSDSTGSGSTGSGSAVSGPTGTFSSGAISVANDAASATLSKGDLETLLTLFDDVVFGVLGLKDESASESGKGKEVVDGLMTMVLEDRSKAKAAKDWAASDAIRDHLKALGITVKDTKDGAEWTIE